MERMRNFTEDWQLNKQSIRERGKYLMENPVWSDCTFLVGTEEPHLREFESHKLLLSISSPVFATMFYGGLPEIQMPIKIVDVQPEAFKSMLEYIYTDTINLESLDQACELCYVAKKYMLPHLLKNCMEYIWKDVDDNTALRAYEFAKLFDEAGISEKSMKIISDHTTEILSKPGALSMSLATMLDILDVDQLNVASELYLFNVLQSWVLFNTPKNGEMIYGKSDASYCDVLNEMFTSRNFRFIKDPFVCMVANWLHNQFSDKTCHKMAHFSPTLTQFDDVKGIEEMLQFIEIDRDVPAVLILR